MAIFKNLLKLLFFITCFSLTIPAEICQSGYAFSKLFDGCIPCKAGTYSPEGEACEKCPPETFSLSASSKCEKCPLGQFR